MPFRHQLLRRLGMFKHGQMDEATYALKIFNLHRKATFPDCLPTDFSALELGPGDSLANALIAKAHGAKTVYLCDVGHYTTTDIKNTKN